MSESTSASNRETNETQIRKSLEDSNTQNAPYFYIQILSKR